MRTMVAGKVGISHRLRCNGDVAVSFQSLSRWLSLPTHGHGTDLILDVFLVVSDPATSLPSCLRLPGIVLDSVSKVNFVGL